MDWESNDDFFKDLDDEVVVDTTAEEMPKVEEEEIEEIPEVTFADLDEEGEEEEIEVDTVEGEKPAETNILKSTAEYQAEKYGLDISDVKEWDEETYSAFVDQIDEIRLEQKYGALKTSNPFAEAILSVLEADGDTNDLIDLFKEQKEFVEIDSSTPEGKLEKIRKYYRDIDNKPAPWIEKHIKRLSLGDDTSDIDEEFTLVSQQYDDFFAEETQRKVEEAQQVKQKRDELLKRQVTGFSQKLVEQKYAKKDTQEMVDFVYNNKYPIKGTDQLLSGFDIAIARAKNNPEALVELTSYLKDPEKFKQKLALKVNNQKEEKKFVQIVKNQQPQNNNKSLTKFTFNKS